MKKHATLDHLSSKKRLIKHSLLARTLHISYTMIRLNIGQRIREFNAEVQIIKVANLITKSITIFNKTAFLHTYNIFSTCPAWPTIPITSGSFAYTIASLMHLLVMKRVSSRNIIKENRNRLKQQHSVRSNIL